jgi:putative ABC transport system permease protein
VGALVGLFGYTAPSSLPFLFGPVVALSCLGLLLSRRFGTEVGTTVVALPLVAFAIMFSVLNRERATGPSGAVLSGVVAVAAGVFLVNALQARIAIGLRRIGRGRGSVPTRLGLANPIAHRVRMLLTVGPFALVIFTLSYAEGLAHLVSSELGRTAPIIGGSYGVFADSSAVQPFDYAKSNIDSIRHVARLGTNYGSFNFDPAKKAKIWPVTGFDTHLTEVAPPPLLRRDKKYKSDKAVYDAVAKNPDLILVTQGFLMSGAFGPAPDDPDEAADLGTSYTFINPVTNQARDVVVVGIRRDDIFAQGAFYGAKGMRALFGKQFVMSDAMLVVDGSRQDTIRRLERAGIANGVQARDIIETARVQFSEAIKIVNLFRSDLGIGIIVGIAGIGVVLVRSVRDRRHQIGTLRAMGFDAREVGLSFLVEGAFVAVQGLLVGAGFGVLTVLAVSKAELVRTLIGFTPPLRFPPVSIGIISAGLFVAALGACVAPARSASKIPPAVALRLVD